MHAPFAPPSAHASATPLCTPWLRPDARTLNGNRTQLYRLLYSCTKVVVQLYLEFTQLYRSGVEFRCTRYVHKTRLYSCTMLYYSCRMIYYVVQL